MDMSPIVSGLGQIAASSQTLIMLAIFLVGFALFYVSTFGKKLRERITETMFSNWQLALLGATGLVLSLASGWTTWDGMRNFTQEPVLSLMITFGIQGVMLIVAWLIGESFATGMNVTLRTRADGTTGRPTWPSVRLIQPIAGTLVGILMFVALAVLILNQAGLDEDQKRGLLKGDWAAFSNQLLFASVAILLVAMLVLNAGGDIRDGYAKAVRVMLRSAILWVMFLACMVTSVFFSFDSLFSTIFPQKERERAAVLRAQNQVAGVVSDVGSLAKRRRIEEQDGLFRQKGWQSYDQTLEALIKVAREAPGQLEAYFERKMRDKQKVVAQRQEEKASAEGQQVRLLQRKGIAISEIGRIKEQVGPLAVEVERLKRLTFEKDREIISKKAEAEAEAGGIGETSKVGRGPKYREISTDLRRLREHKKNLELQLREFGKRLDKARAAIAKTESELRLIDGQLAQLRGRAQTAEQLIVMAQKAQQQDAPQFDPTNGLRQLERARIAFRQDPTQLGLSRIQGLCTTLVSAMTGMPSLKARARSIDCDPRQASEAAARVFALNVGIQALNKNCVGGGKLPQTGGADALFGFARSCVQDAGLPSVDTDKLRTKINYLELNRDDKAHRFVVTTNAFQDGNKLAYLALSIAIAIDTLVFMSGLFGANAVRSPLSDVPTEQGRSALRLEAVIDTSLGPHAYDTACQVLGALHPITADDGFTAEVTIQPGDPHAADIRRVLNAGASIGAVRHLGTHNRIYQVRAELFEYLSMVAKREFEKDKSHGNIAQLERTLSVALLPHSGENAEMVLSHLHPIQEHKGFMAEIQLGEIEEHDIRTVRSALNAGALYERVQRVGADTTHYYIHGDFFKTLLTIRGRLLLSGRHAVGEVPAIGVEPVPATALHGRDIPPTAISEAESEDPQHSMMQPLTQLRGTDTAQEPQSMGDDESILDAYRDRLVKAMGIDPSIAAERLSSPGLLSAANKAWSSLISQGEGNRVLGSLIRAHSNDLDLRVSEELSEIRSGLAGDQRLLRLLYDADAQIKEHFDTLMLFPECGLLDFLIESLEVAAGPDDGLNPDEHLLKVGLSMVRDAFVGSDVSSASSWENLAENVAQLPSGGSVIRFKDGNGKNRRSAG